MTLIEGIGDEVTHFFLLLAVGTIALIAWWSTNLSERPLIRTVFIVERRTIRQTQSDPQTLTANITAANDILQEGNEEVTESKTSQSNTIADSEIEVNLIEQCNASEGIESSPLQEEVKSEDASESAENDSTNEKSSSETADESVLRKRRLAFFEMRQENKDVSQQNEADGGALPSECEAQNDADDGNIRIRLKYLNDDQKLVEGKLQEQLGDFKKRHFSIELGARKLVRLIFNGQVLQEDTKTLQNCGLFDNCVVHCLVHTRTPPPSPNLNRTHSENQGQNESSPRWDLGSFLFASLSLLLVLAWYGRYHYSQLYTATTTVALVGLTGIFTVSLIGMYMPDTDGVRT